MHLPEFTQPWLFSEKKEHTFNISSLSERPKSGITQLPEAVPAANGVGLA